MNIGRASFTSLFDIPVVFNIPGIPIDQFERRPLDQTLEPALSFVRPPQRQQRLSSQVSLERLTVEWRSHGVLKPHRWALSLEPAISEATTAAASSGTVSSSRAAA